MAEKIIIIVFMLFVLACQAHAAVNCTSAGRFADPDDTTCKNYTLCVYSSTTNSYVAYDYVCPTTSLFNPTLSQCTSSYVCNVTINNSTTPKSVCTAEGYFDNSSSSNCSTYIECILINSTYVETTYSCPDGTYFNPNTTLCEPDYNCTKSTTFTCSSAGRFADTTDKTCQRYYYCVRLSNGAYVQYNYTCPSTSLFNPYTNQCTASYSCTGIVQVVPGLTIL